MMTTESKRTARTAGFLYLIVIICGTLYLQCIPSLLKLKSDPSTVVYRLIKGKILFKAGITCEIFCWMSFSILPVILYWLLKPVNSTAARLMVIFAAVQVPVALVNLLNKFAVLSLVDTNMDFKTVRPEQLPGQIYFYLNLYQQGNLINQVFWGLWLLPFGYLVFKSTFLPKILGASLIAGCFGYLIDFGGNLFMPAYEKMTISNYITLPASLGEIGICLWLMIIGIKDNKLPHNTTATE